MTIEIDTTTEFGARALRRLRDEEVAWITTVSPRSAPVPSLIWFWWDGERALMFSQPGTLKLRNIAANPRVTLNLNSVAGGDVVVLAGSAEIGSAPSDSDTAAYLAKYAELIAANGWTPESFAADYSVPVRITPTRLRGH